jgi:hypothetical protein
MYLVRPTSLLCRSIVHNSGCPRIHTRGATTWSHLSQWMRWLVVQAVSKELVQSLHGSDSIEEKFCTFTEGNKITQTGATRARMTQQGTSYYQWLRCGTCCSISVLQGSVARFSIWCMWYWVPIEYHIGTPYWTILRNHWVNKAQLSCHWNMHPTSGVLSMRW